MASDPVAGGTVEREVFLEPVVPMLERLRERVSQHVALHIIGGMVVDGRIESVNDDLTVTVYDRTDDIDQVVAVSAIAVMVVK